MIIAFMGIDGSGKTSISKSIEQNLKQMGKNVKYRAEFSYTALDFLQKTFLKNKFYRTRKQFLTRKRKISGIFKIWPYLVFLDCLVTYLKCRIFSRRKIIIFDRYFYDYIIAFEGLGEKSRFVRRMFLSIPKPDVGFLLDVSPQIAYERRKDIHNEDIEWFTMWRNKYLELNQKLNFKVVSSEKPFEAKIDEILACLS